MASLSTSSTVALSRSNIEINRTTVLANALPSHGTASIHTKGLAASTLISPGSTVLSTTKPYHIMLENSVLASVCSWCLLPPPTTSDPLAHTSTSETGLGGLNEVKDAQKKLKRCARCHTPSYCSPTCQKAHWTSTHKHECPVLASLSQRHLPGPLPTPVRALMQIMLLPDKGRPWLGLESHEEEFRREKGIWEDVVLQARGAVMYAGLGVQGGEQGMEREVMKAVSLLCRMKTNSFRFTSPTASGLLFDPTLATANHSCAPNAELECHGRRVQLVALREINEGEQVFISYIDEELPVRERKAMLRERYFFDCECERCVPEAGDGSKDPA